MVEKRKNYLKLLFCVLLAVILPFSFVGCKTKSNPNPPQAPSQYSPKDDGNNKDNSGDNSGDGEQDETPIQETVFSASDVKNILLSQEDGEYVYTALCDDYISSLNTISDELQEKSYDESVGGVTATVLSCLKYAYDVQFYLNYLNLDLELDKFYAYYDISNTKNYKAIKVCVEKNEKIITHMFSVNWQNDAYSFDYNKLVLEVDNGAITALNVSKFSSQNGSSIDFQNARFGFDDLTLVMSYGTGISTSSNDAKKYLKDNFTVENFSNVIDLNKNSMCYESLCFKENSCDVVVFSGEEAKSNMISDISNFGFLNAYDIKDEFESTVISQKIVLSGDIYNQVTLAGEWIAYGEYRFEKNKGQSE